VARDFVAPIRARYDAPKPAAAARPKPRLDEDEAAEVRRVRRTTDDERRTRAAQTAANAKADFNSIIERTEALARARKEKKERQKRRAEEADDEQPRKKHRGEKSKKK
jgi:hypothetical protein